MAGGAGENAKELRKIYSSETDARDAAEAEHSRMERGKARMDIPVALGSPDLFPDRGVNLTDWSPEIDAEAWLIAETAYATDATGGLATKVTLETAG